MSVQGPRAVDLEQFLASWQQKELLRFITCGSVDDGKSTLIGRLLYECSGLLEDQLAALVSDSKKWGTQGGSLDLALLVDGLAAEREQGITIDVAYRFFSTPRRKFIIADTPGHEQYTRNMVTGASTADAALVLVDARKGVLTQTRRHTYLASLMGLRDVVVVVNKMDLVDYSEARFREISADFARLSQRLGLTSVDVLPASALRGDNIATRSAAMPWFEGKTLLEHLETIAVDDSGSRGKPFRFPVQWVNRANADFRGFAGTVASGSVRAGERIRVLPSGRESRIARIVTQAGDLPVALAGQSVTLTLEDEVDISRGDMISTATEPPQVADQFQATVVWMHDEPMLPGRSYLVKLGSSTGCGTFTELKHEVDVNTHEPHPAKTLRLNAIGLCNLQTDRPLAFDPYRENRETGAFIVIDRLTSTTVGAGMIHFALRRASNIHRQPAEVRKEARTARNGHKPCVLWFTGLSGSGKSTIANRVEMKLHAMGCHTYLLDGDNLRHGLNKDLGFTPADRVENIRRAAEVARLMVEAGLIVLTAFISPYQAERELARGLVDEGEFLEVFVDVPLEVAESRDPKGLYRKARRGALLNFTGIDAPYEPPRSPALRLDASVLGPEEASREVVELLLRRQVISAGA